jgi:hypothetical protein
VLDSMLYETLKWPQITPFCTSSEIIMACTLLSLIYAPGCHRGHDRVQIWINYNYPIRTSSELYEQWVWGSGLWCLKPLSSIFQLQHTKGYRCGFIGGGNQSTRRTFFTCSPYWYVGRFLTLSPFWHARNISASRMTWFIRYIFYSNLQLLNHVIIIKTKVLLP